MAWLLVGLQVVLLVAIVIVPGEPGLDVPEAVRALGYGLVGVGFGIVLLATFGLGDSLTPSPLPREGGSLVTTGLYRQVRHPIYSGVLLIGLGLTVSNASLWRLVVLVALLGLFTVKTNIEERALRARYEGYADYALRTPRFVPMPWRRR